MPHMTTYMNLNSITLRHIKINVTWSQLYMKSKNTDPIKLVTRIVVIRGRKSKWVKGKDKLKYHSFSNMKNLLYINVQNETEIIGKRKKYCNPMGTMYLKVYPGLVQLSLSFICYLVHSWFSICVYDN